MAWEPLGWLACWFAEVDRAASEVLACRYPSVPNHGDMTLLPAAVRARRIPAPDVLVGGTPCQAFSVAGMRQGLADPRGKLTLAFVDLANAIDEVREQPCIIVWENVPGVLSSKDNAFGCFLAGLAGETEPLVPSGGKWTNAGVVLGPQRAVAWRIIDAQYVGLAQRRRRVFVVAGAAEGFDPAAILFEFDGVRRDSPPSRETRESAAHPVAPCLTSSGRGVERTGDPRGQDPIVGVVLGRDTGIVPTLDASYGRLQGCAGQDASHGHGHLMPMAFGGNNTAGPISVATARNAHAGPHGRLDFESETFVVEPIPFDTTQITSQKNYSAPKAGDPCHPLACGAHPPALAFTMKDYGGDAVGELSPTLRSMGHADSHANGGGQIGVAYSVALRGRDGGSTAELGDEVAGCLRASGGGGGKPHVLTGVDDAVCVTEPVTHTLRADGFDASEDGTGRGQPITPVYAIQERAVSVNIHAGPDGRGYRDDGAAYTLEARANVQAIATRMAVRRLMPVECERLQGFPDDYTLVPIGSKQKLAADGPRYKQLRNSMAVNVMHWIGKRINENLYHRGGVVSSSFQDILG